MLVSLMSKNLDWKRRQPKENTVELNAKVVASIISRKASATNETVP